MRGLVQFEAARRGAFGRFSGLALWWRNCKVRKDLQLLEFMDDYMLRDIGLTRGEVRRLLSLPNGVDLLWEVERIRVVRGRG